jgi:hypothetical protein
VFEHPWYLLAAVTALVPIIVGAARYYRLRTVDLRAPVFLMSRGRAFWRLARLRRTALAGTRIALVLVLALIFALPVRLGWVSGGASARNPESLLVLVDDSLPMAWSDGTTSLLRRALDLARLAAEQSGATRFALKTACRLGGPPAFLDLEGFLLALESVKQAHALCPGMEDPTAALAAAPPGTRAVAVGLCGPSNRQTAGLERVCVPPPATTAGRGLLDASCQSRQRCQVTIQGYPSQGEGRLRAACRSEPSEFQAFEFRFQKMNPLLLELEVPLRCKDPVLLFSLDGDAFAPDDSLEVVMPEDRPRMVLLVDGALGSRAGAGPTAYLQQAFLAARDRGTNLLLRVLGQDELPAQRLGEADLIVLVDPRLPRRHITERLLRAVEEGATLVLTAGPNLALWPDGQGLIPGGWKSEPVSDAAVVLGSVKGRRGERPDSEAGAVRGPVFEKRFLPFGFNSDTTERLLAFSDGAPAVLAWNHGRGRVFFWLFSADQAFGEYPLDPAFPGLLEAPLSRQSGMAASLMHCWSGQPCPAADLDSPWELRSPHGFPVTELMQALREGNPLVPPGVYQRLRAGFFEPVLELRQSPATLLSAVAKGLTATSQPSAPHQQAAPPTAPPLPLHFPLLLLLLGLLLLETRLSR